MGRREAPDKGFAAGRPLAEAELNSAEHKKDGPLQNQRFCGGSLARIKSMSEETGAEFVDELTIFARRK